MPSQESIDLLYRALNLWKVAGDNPSGKQYRDTVSLINLAIKKAGEPLPFGHSLLAQIHFDVENYEAAWGATEAALSLDPYDFKSQLIRVYLAYAQASEAAEHGREQRTTGLGAMFNLFRPKGFRDSWQTGQALGEAMSSGILPNRLRKLFNQELKKLLDVFEHKCTDGCTASEFLEYASRLTKLADGIYENPKLVDAHPNIYGLIANARTDQIEFETDDERHKVETAMLIAEGRTA